MVAAIDGGADFDMLSNTAALHGMKVPKSYKGPWVMACVCADGVDFSTLCMLPRRPAAAMPLAGTVVAQSGH